MKTKMNTSEIVSKLEKVGEMKPSEVLSLCDAAKRHIEEQHRILFSASAYLQGRLEEISISHGSK